MLFYRKCPQMAVFSYPGIVVEDIVIAKIKPEREAIIINIRDVGYVTYGKKQIVDRKNSQGTADVELFERLRYRLVLRFFQQNVSNQKSA
uniref:Uncharacterized protein n=1 Tax=Candidatus Nitrotoga fabula TaxID=2182327 RepID=A0A2X0QWZ3_9PROT|nr:protein of unknown function [Candidatus Nitrotoga fabula]